MKATSQNSLLHPRKHSPIVLPRHGGVAQLGERLTGSQEVRGSIPLVSTRALNEAPTQVGAFFINMDDTDSLATRDQIVR